MKTIGILFGMENSFPGALVEQINARNLDGIRAEFVETGAVQLDTAPRYAVIVDRISHDIPFYRAYLKHAAIHGTVVINNPFWWSADDKFFNYTLAGRLGVAVPPTVILPHKQHPEGTTEKSMRNLEYPLDWEGVFAYAGEHGFLKPVNGGGWRNVHPVHDREEFFKAYDQSRDLCMMYQKVVEFTEYFRCYVVGQKKVHIMPYDPRKPHAERYIREAPACGKKLLKRMEQDALKLCQALGYDLNTVEFAVEKGIPYAIDFMNPAPDADLLSVGQANFDWIVNEVADLAIAKARQAPAAAELRWAAFLGAEAAAEKAAAKRTRKLAAKKKPAGKKLAAKSAKAGPKQRKASKKAEAVAVAVEAQAHVDQAPEVIEPAEATMQAEAAEIHDAIAAAEVTEPAEVAETQETVETAEVTDPAEAVIAQDTVTTKEVTEPEEVVETQETVETAEVTKPVEAVIAQEAAAAAEVNEPTEAGEPAETVEAQETVAAAEVTEREDGPED